ncbi:MAG: hypothetical protein H6707_07590 [Deltaproteobacteria bacterium]|nr:hypothetical protein [Deltaproteobacteria bacterium]
MRTWAVITLTVCCLSMTAHADHTIQLVDNTEIVGKLLHFYDGVATIELPNKSRMRLPLEKIRAMRFRLPKPRAELSTPKKAFTRLKQAALRGDIQTYVDCHSAYYQMLLNHQVQAATPAKFAQQLKQQWGDATLTILNTEVKGAMAVIKVRRKQGNDSQDGELRFVRENNEWKMILPL